MVVYGYDLFLNQIKEARNKEVLEDINSDVDKVIHEKLTKLEELKEGLKLMNKGNAYNIVFIKFGNLSKELEALFGLKNILFEQQNNLEDLERDAELF